MKPLLVLAFGTLVACGHSTVQHAPAPPVAMPAPSLRSAPSCIASRPNHAERIAAQGSVLDQYHRQDGVWLAHAPVLVNEDFDFALAMSMEDGLGAGLAAVKRKENNQKRAQELADLRLGAELDAKLEELCDCGRDVYFVLWGRDGKMKMVLEGKGTQGIVDGDAAIGRDSIVKRVLELVANAGCR